MELSPVEKLDVILKRENISYSDLAGRLGSSRQAVSNFFRAAATAQTFTSWSWRRISPGGTTC